MSDQKQPTPSDENHPHPTGRRCCGRPISEKCSPEEEAANTNEQGKKSCCKGNHS